jgi:Flp pilus assembly protein TadG
MAKRRTSRLAKLILRFGSNSKGNIAVMFALACIPILTAVGSAIDYSTAVRMQSKLQIAADAASVGAIAQSSPGYVAAELMTSNGSVAAGVADSSNIFNANMTNVTGFTNLVATPTVTKTNSTLTSNVQFSAKVPVMFLQVIGYQTLTVTGTSSSTASLPLYLDFYLMLDVSGSMGLPSTNNEETRLTSINPDNFSAYPNGCAFACHFTAPNACSSGEKYNASGYCMGYTISRVSQAGYAQILSNHSGALPSYRISNLPASLYPYNPLFPSDPALTPVSSCATDGTDACIQLRADAVGYAVTQLFVTANATEKVVNQFRIGLYPFIQNLYAYFPLTSSINGSVTNSSTINYAAANLASLLDTGVNSSLGSGGTHFENAFPSMNTIISSVGNGSAWNNTLPYVFLVTDGSQNFQTQWNQSWSGSNSATVMNTALCTTLKNRGITISVLYIPYQPIQNPTTFANSEDFSANANIPNIPPNLLACASPNFFFTASTPADIATALNAMFNQALVTAHITN